MMPHLPPQLARAARSLLIDEDPIGLSPALTGANKTQGLVIKRDLVTRTSENEESWPNNPAVGKMRLMRKHRRESKKQTPPEPT